MMYKFLSSIFLLLLCSAQLTFAFDSKIQGVQREGCVLKCTTYDQDISDNEIEKFIFSLKDAILKDDRKKVVALANCTKKRPCILNKISYTGILMITSSKMFLENYNKIINNHIKNTLKKLKTIEDICPGIWGFTIKTEGPFIILFDPTIGVVAFNPNKNYKK